MWQVSVATWTLLVLTGSSVLGVTPQDKIDNIAAYLDIKIEQQTNYIPSHPVETKFLLTNTHKSLALVTPDIRIYFFTKLEFKNLPQTQGHLLLWRGDLAYNCLYTLQTQHIPSISAGQTIALTATARQLVLNKYIIHPRFLVTSSTGGVDERVIKSTDDDDLKFVSLAPANMTANEDDVISQLSAFRRYLTNPRVQDMRRVAEQIVLPTPQRMELWRPAVTPGTPPRPSKPEDTLVDMAKQPDKRWYVMFGPGLQEKTQQYIMDSLNFANITKTQFYRTNVSLPSRAMIYVRLSSMPNATDDAYRLIVRRPGGTRKRDMVHISAKAETGILNGFHSFLDILGRFSMLPACTLTDDAYLGHRGLTLNLAKNFYPVSELGKIVDLCARFKMNELVLGLGDNEGWRLQLPASLDFPELVTVGARRCLKVGQCLPPSYGSGLDPNSPGNGYLKMDELRALVNYGGVRKVTVVPKINFFGSNHALIVASNSRYNRLKDTNPTEAAKYHLAPADQMLPPPDPDSGDQCFLGATLNPCLTATKTFIADVMTELSKAFSGTGVRGHIHVGGDSSVKRWHLFPACQTAGSQSKILQDTIVWFQSGRPEWRMRLNEVAVTDTATNMCFPENGNFRPSSIIVEITNVDAGDNSDWQLNATALQWLNRPEVIGQFGPSMHMADILTPYPGNKTRVAPFSTGYDCANKGYKVILTPPSFTGLDAMSELDFRDEGTYEKDKFTILSLSRILSFSPRNYYSNVDAGPRGEPLRTHRLCYLMICTPLQPGKELNIVGLHASLDGAIARTVAQLHALLTPRLLAAAERGWHAPMLTNLARPEAPTTYQRLPERMMALDMNVRNFYNNLGYKELNYMEYLGLQHKIPRPGAHYVNTMFIPKSPPFPVMPMTEIPGSEFEVRVEGHKTWKPFFTKLANGTGLKPYEAQFPWDPKEVIYLRTVSYEKRHSQPERLVGRNYKVVPQDVPPLLRQNTRLRIAGPNEQMEPVDLSSLDPRDTATILENLKRSVLDTEQFQRRREQELKNILLRQRSNKTLEQIEEEIMRGVPPTPVHQAIFEGNRRLMMARQEVLRQRLLEYHLAQVRAGNITTTPLPPTGPPGAGGMPGGMGQMFPGGGAAFPPGGGAGFPQGGAQFGGAPQQGASAGFAQGQQFGGAPQQGASSPAGRTMNAAAGRAQAG